ncbi:RNA polymerase subunit sigma-24 [Burkholderia sp. HI2714]|nr:RNA polymerase subunit sigma-24 [Burkholderia sp. HI2714]
MVKNEVQAFHTLRPRLQKIAYRMLGSVADAEDIVQDVWLRWHDAPHDDIEIAEAWLVAITTRLSIDRLRTAKIRREDYVGIWLPEPALGDSPATPEEMTARASEVSVAFLMLLERLTPEARAAFLLHEVFDIDYDRIADAIGKTKAACRQLVSRAKTQLRNDDGPRRGVPPDTHRQLLQMFARAATLGDFPSIQALLAEDATLIGDGGGKVPSVTTTMLGGRRIAQLFYATWLHYGSEMKWRLVILNGEWGLLRFMQDRLESAQSFETDGTQIVRIFMQRNPDKLARIAATCLVD